MLNGILAQNHIHMFRKIFLHAGGVAHRERVLREDVADPVKLAGLRVRLFQQQIEALVFRIFEQGIGGAVPVSDDPAGADHRVQAPEKIEPGEVESLVCPILGKVFLQGRGLLLGGGFLIFFLGFSFSAAAFLA